MTNHEYDSGGLFSHREQPTATHPDAAAETSNDQPVFSSPVNGSPREADSADKR